jgi:predicted restriction endonuclease
VNRIQNEDERNEALANFTEDQLKKNILKKKLGASWNDSGEAGDFVEVCSRGGILMYHKAAHRGEYRSIHLLISTMLNL